MRSDTPPEAAFGAPPEAAFGAPLRIPGLPPIRRARGCRLYDVNGRRYLDLCRDGALLGHRAEGTLTVTKSVLSQGLAAALPSIWEKRLLTAIARRFPDHARVRLYASLDRARLALQALLRGAGDRPWSLHDPARDGELPDGAAAAAWRPFLETPRARALVLLLPVTLVGAPVPVCFGEDPPTGVPASDPIPGFVLAAALRGFLAAAAVEGRRFAADPALQRAIDSAPGWARRGPYVRAVFEASDYPAVYEEFLHAGVLLAPAWPGPSVLPPECSVGESRRIAELFTRIPGG
jgi:hypothetical protein